jgi:hypothetical protein
MACGASSGAHGTHSAAAQSRAHAKARACAYAQYSPRFRYARGRVRATESARCAAPIGPRETGGRTDRSLAAQRKGKGKGDLRCARSLALQAPAAYARRGHCSTHV